MTKLNQIQALKEWKAQHGKNKNQPDKSAVKNNKNSGGGNGAEKAQTAPQGNAITKPSKDKGQAKETAQAKNKALFVDRSQLNRVFTLTNMATERNKADFPEHFHFRHKLAKECDQLVESFYKGGGLIKILMKAIEQGEIKQPENYLEDLAQFVEGASYIKRKLREIAQHVQAVERGEYEPTAYPNPQSQQKPTSEELAQ